MAGAASLISGRILLKLSRRSCAIGLNKKSLKKRTNDQLRDSGPRKREGSDEREAMVDHDIRANG